MCGPLCRSKCGLGLRSSCRVDISDSSHYVSCVQSQRPEESLTFEMDTVSHVPSFPRVFAMALIRT